MCIRRIARGLAAFLLLVTWAQTARAQPVSDAVAKVIRGQSAKPRLVIVIVIDQFRADYLTRFGDLFLSAQTGETWGGFQYLMQHGAHFANARFEHFPLFTAPGHATILTGAHPYKTGIIGNDWWDQKNGRYVYCVDDPRWQTVGVAEGSSRRAMGPMNLRCSTVGDELKLANRAAKVVTLAIKDRGAILLGGHAQDLSLWYDSSRGSWISSSAYCRDGRLPDWVQTFNDEHIPDRMLGQQWINSLPAEVLAARTFAPKVVGSQLPKGFGEQFPHPIGAEKTQANYRAFIFTPAANAFVFETAQRAITAETMGRDEIPDILAISLSTNDYVGHAFGPYSPEALEITVQTDRQLSGFINFIAKNVPDGLQNVVWVLSADHGTPPVPEDFTSPPFNGSGGRFKVAEVLDTISNALTARFGAPPAANDGTAGTWYAKSARGGFSAAFMDGYIYLNPEAVAKALADGKALGITRRDIEQTACDAINHANIAGVYGCYGKTQILEGRIGNSDLARRLALGVHPQISPDLIILPEQFYVEDPMPEGHAAKHGSPYAYDTHVPVVIAAPGLIRPGVYLESVSPADIAPTLSILLGIELPSACDGQPLLPALRP